MKAIETTATIDDQGRLTLDGALGVTTPQRVRLIILIDEADDADPDEPPTEEAIAGIQQGLQEAFSGQTLPLSALWEGIDAE